MAKYEISHPELPQVRGILELEDGEEPSDQHFWEATKTMVRPYGASQLSNEAKISAYRNGFFDTPSGPILDVDDDPETIQDEESPGLLSTLGDMVDNLGTRIDPLTSPYSKVLQLDDEAVSYDKTENIEQFREAGKRLFGLLDNQESLGDLGFDPISEALKQTGMPFYQKNKDARGRVKAAAMDYASDNIKSSVGMGTARAWKTPEFLLRGGAALSNYLTLDEEDDGEVLSYVNSLIGFDKVNYEYETAAEFAAWVMDNPVDALKGTVGIEPESMTFDSQLEQDLRSGFQVPSEGIGLAFEVVGDPLNAAGGTLAKGVTAPMRIGLKGRMLKTIQDVQQKTIQLAKYQNTLQKLPTDIANKSLQALIRSRITKESAKLADELAEQQKVLQKYGSNSLHLRLMGKASPETLGKVAMETFDQSTDAGKMGMGLVQEATKATDKMSKLRRVANTAAKLNPEIAGASVGALVAGPIGAAVGASLPTIAKIGRFLSSMTENSAIRYIINSERQAGREVTIESARQRYKNFKNLSGTALGLGSAAGFSFDQDALGGGAAVAALATFIGPKALSLYDNIARDARVVGSELTLARTGDHTPFFRRLSMLPTPDQGLAGATMDKFNILMKPSPEGLASRVKDAIAQGSRASAKEVNPSAQPFRVGPGGEKIGQAPTISNATQKVANFLDNAGAVGRLGTPLETLGRFGKGMAAGASLPATIGFVASAGQPSGAVAGAIMSAPFTALGAGAGMYENYKTKGDLYSKQIGDIQYYREHLTKSEQAEFDAMPAHIRTQIAGYSLSHPDVVFKQTTKGEGEFDPITMEVSYNPNGSGYLKGTLAHELTHFMEVHGLTPMVNRILFGDKETKTAGEFASYDKDGNVIYTDEFIELRDIYMDRLRKDASLDPEAVADYEANPQKIGREIFADQGADFLLTGKREKALNQGPAGKAIQATIDGITGVSFLRDFLLKLNQPLNADGKFITSTDLFKGKLRKIPELQNLIEKYYKDVRGLKKAEIEGSEFTDPNTGKTRKTEGKKPIDDEFETLYTVEDQKNPNVVDKLNTGGIYKTNPQTGEIEKDALGNPIRMTGTEANKVSEAAGDHAADVLQKNGIDVETNDKGRPFAKDLPALSEAVIDQLAKGPIHPRQIAALREISRALRQGDGERAGMLIGYYSATQGRKPKAVPFAVRTTMPYGFELTAQGNILVRIHDVGQIQKNLEFLKGERQPKKLPDDLIGMYDELFGNDNAVWDAFSLYRQNTANGIDGRTGLDADPVIANKKLNFLNALHGGITKSQVAMNPVLDAIGYNMAAINKKHNPFGPATKTFRLDRVFNAERSGKASPVNEQRVINLMSPEAQKLFMPTETFEGSPGSYFRPKSSRDTSAQVRTFKSPVQLKDGSRLSGVADNPEQSPFYGFDKNGQEFSQGREYINPQDITKSRDSDRTANQIRNELESGQKLFIPAFHGTPHTLAPEAGAPLGRFRTSKIGTGEGAQAYGHGLYFAGKREVAEFYRKQSRDGENRLFDGKAKDSTNIKHLAADYLADEMGVGNYMSLNSNKSSARRDLISWMESSLKDIQNNPSDYPTGKYQEFQQVIKTLRDQNEADVTIAGSLYKVELAPKENEYLLYDKTLGEQPKGVQDKLKKFLREQEGEDTWQYRQEQDYRDITNNVLDDMPEAEISKRLKEAGIPGIKYLDGASRSKGEGDFNYVIFDEADVTVTDKLFMPASEAGATKGKVAEAAKLWNEKGIDSPYFKKWFGKSKVVDDNGEPLVVYHGTSDKFTAFDADRYQTINKGDFGEGFYFTPKKGQARLYSQDAIKKTDPEVLALQKEYEAQAKQLGTSTMMAAIDLGLNSPEYKKLQQFESKLDQKLQSINKGNDEIIIDSYLSLENPLIVKSTSASDPFLAQSAKERGHDGIIVKFDNGRIDEIVAFSPEQIKSATGNRGTFDAGERNILFMPASELKKQVGAKQAKEIQYKRLFMPTSKDGEDYRGYHLAPDRDNGAPLHDVTDMYPSDIYGPNGARYYGTGDPILDAKSIAIIQEMYGNPDGEVTIYRAVPEFADEIRPNDWVTIVREYAELHGESGNAGGDNYNILSKKVKASELFTEANSLHEWGWSPEDKSSKQFMPSDPKAPKAQPANRIQQQAPAMPGNRFMAPAASAGAKLSERFR